MMLQTAAELLLSKHTMTISGDKEALLASKIFSAGIHGDNLNGFSQEVQDAYKVLVDQKPSESSVEATDQLLLGSSGKEEQILEDILGIKKNEVEDLIQHMQGQLAKKNMLARVGGHHGEMLSRCAFILLLKYTGHTQTLLMVAQENNKSNGL